MQEPPSEVIPATVSPPFTGYFPENGKITSSPPLLKAGLLLWAGHNSSPSRLGCPVWIESAPMFYGTRLALQKSCTSPRCIPSCNSTTIPGETGRKRQRVAFAGDIPDRRAGMGVSLRWLRAGRVKRLDARGRHRCSAPLCHGGLCWIMKQKQIG